MDIVIHSNCPSQFEIKQPLKGYGHAYLNLFKCLGYGDDEYPVADWLRQYHGLKGEWIVVSPIYWQATHNDAMLLACGRELNCTDVENRAVFDVFSAFAEEEGLEVYYHDQYMWLLKCGDKPPIKALPPYTLLHQSMFTHLHQLDSTLSWQRFLTEVQMLFAQHLGASSKINGIWIWGGGRLKTPSNRFIEVFHQNHLEMACLLSTNVYFGGEQVGISASRRRALSKNALFWFDSLTLEEYKCLLSQLKPYMVNWYWDNLAYQTPKSSWFKTIFSKDRHAY